MSYSPHAFGFFSPTGWALCSLFAFTSVVFQVICRFAGVEHGPGSRAAGVFIVRFGGQLHAIANRKL